MAGLVPAIHVFALGEEDVDARNKCGHDESALSILFSPAQRRRNRAMRISFSLKHDLSRKPVPTQDQVRGRLFRNHAFASFALIVMLGHGALAQNAPAPAALPAEVPQPEQQAEAPPANPLQPTPPTEASPPPAPASVLPLPPAAPPATPLQQETVRVKPETASYLQEIGVDPNAREVIEISQDSIGAVTLDSLAAERDETKVRRFIYTRTFMHHFLADPDNVRIEPDKYDIGFLTPEEVNLIADELNK